MKFSIIIPTLFSKTLPNTIRSLEEQTFSQKDFEVIIVGKDDFSFLDKKTHTFPITVISSEVPLPPSKGRNQGTKIAKGEIFVFLDSDCLPRKEWLSLLAKRFEDQTIAVVGGGVKFIEYSFWDTADNFSFFHEFLATNPPGRRIEFPSLNLAIRREVFLLSNGFDEKYPAPAGEDFELTRRITKLGYVSYFDPEAWVVHDSRRDSLSKVWSHAKKLGYFTTKGNLIPSFARNTYIILLLSPIIAFAITIYNYLTTPNSLRFIRYGIGVYLSKVGWLFGLAKSLR